MINATRILINQSSLGETRIADHNINEADLSDDVIVLEIDCFGFSANNITYAALGNSMGYWGFFPAPSGFGILPVWGLATVVHSNNADIEIGKKVYGYLPMATHLVVKPSKISKFGFFDTHENRKSISPVYDNYLFCDSDPGYNPSREAWQLNFRPLFMTSFVLDEFVSQYLSSEQAEHTTNLLITSASSKTAFGLAHLLQANKAKRSANYQIIGITSEKNRKLVQSLGCYDDIVVYEDLTSIENQNSWLLDFASNGQVIQAIGEHLANKLSKITLIGATDWKAQKHTFTKQMNAEIFFAPDWVRKLNQDWGQAAFLQQYTHAWKHVAGALHNKMYEAQITGVNEILTLYQHTLLGQAHTNALNLVRF